MEHKTAKIFLTRHVHFVSFKDQLEYKNKHRYLKVKMLDGAIKTVMVCIIRQVLVGMLCLYALISQGFREENRGSTEQMHVWAPENSGTVNIGSAHPITMSFRTL